jgi:hypothetical protein
MLETCSTCGAQFLPTPGKGCPKCGSATTPDEDWGAIDDGWERSGEHAKATSAPVVTPPAAKSEAARATGPATPDDLPTEARPAAARAVVVTSPAPVTEAPKADLAPTTDDAPTPEIQTRTPLEDLEAEGEELDVPTAQVKRGKRRTRGKKSGRPASTAPAPSAPRAKPRRAAPSSGSPRIAPKKRVYPPWLLPLVVFLVAVVLVGLAIVASRGKH